MRERGGRLTALGLRDLPLPPVQRYVCSCSHCHCVPPFSGARPPLEALGETPPAGRPALVLLAARELDCAAQRLLETVGDRWDSAIIASRAGRRARRGRDEGGVVGGGGAAGLERRRRLLRQLRVVLNECWGCAWRLAGGVGRARRGWREERGGEER